MNPWGWILIGLVVLGGIIAIARSSSKKGRRYDDGDSGLGDVVDTALDVHDMFDDD